MQQHFPIRKGNWDIFFENDVHMLLKSHVVSNAEDIYYIILH